MFDGNKYRYDFQDAAAVLPVIMKAGPPIVLPWGRRESEDGSLPIGGWASLESIHNGEWDRWFARPVKLPITSFMEKNTKGVKHWFDIIEGQYIQGLVAREGQERRVYCVCIQADGSEPNDYSRWPRIIFAL